MIGRLLPVALGAALLALASASLRAAEPELWLYCSTNLLVDRNAADCEALLRRAGAAGYRAMLLNDSKFCRLGSLPPSYAQHLQAVQAAAVAAHVELVPAVCPVGYSSDLLSQDPDLAEALPVREAHYRVHQGVLTLVPELPVALPPLTDLRRWTWHDPVVQGDGPGVRVQDPDGNARVVAHLSVMPFREYHLSVWVRTDAFTGTPEVKVLDGDACLTFSDLGVAATQPWQEHHVVFNSLAHTQVNVYLGQWGPARGTLRWKDARLEETGLMNLVRRPGAPLTIHDAQGHPVAEGVGAAVDPVRDPLMGRRHWPGDYDVWHAPPVIRSRLPEGTELRLSYYHTITVGDGQVMLCPSEPAAQQLLARQVREVDAVFHARRYFLSHDEIRVLNWDAACQHRHLTPGQILADNVRTCIAAVHAVAPTAGILVWSDMFDPNHNAHDHYYLVNGTLAGSWEGLPPGITIALWNQASAAASAAFFAHRGDRLLIAGYYDRPVAGIDGWLSATASAPVDAVMYTTWQGNYRDLEAFAARVRQHTRAGAAAP